MGTERSPTITLPDYRWRVGTPQRPYLGQVLQVVYGDGVGAVVVAHHARVVEGGLAVGGVVGEAEMRLGVVAAASQRHQTRRRSGSRLARVAVTGAAAGGRCRPGTRVARGGAAAPNPSSSCLGALAVSWRRGTG